MENTIDTITEANESFASYRILADGANQNAWFRYVFN